MTLSIMLQGTGSDVGKTVLVAGLCRALSNRGLQVRPFKPQNMSNNAAVTPEGGEIGRAQWLQALACRVAPSVHMNPVLLKPQSETGSQVIVHGRMTGSAKGRDYQQLKPRLLNAVVESFEKIKAEGDIVIVEGAGSPAEINLRAGDIANMGFATRADVPVLLVGDIDRGGVIASLVGTHTILSAEDKSMIIGFLINKFRGDVSLFDDGLRSITQFTGWPSFGVVPWLKDAARLPAEDSVALERLVKSGTGGCKIAVPILDRIANFDDLDALVAEGSVEVDFVQSGTPLPDNADVVIIPGSKSTISDLVRFRENGWDAQICAHVAAGKMVIGICGGYQMLGRTISDPEGIEGPPTKVDGLGLLNVDTIMMPEKQVRAVNAHSKIFDAPLTGYEIHIGETTGPDCARPTSVIDGRIDGAMSSNGLVHGTYLHGYFDSGKFRSAWLQSMGIEADGKDQVARVSEALDAIAIELEGLIDIDGLLAAASAFVQKRQVQSN